jgi:CheY-like chemotaxis protein
VGTARRILVVDDDPDLAEVLRVVLARSGYSVGLAANGVEALGYLRRTAGVQVVLLDLMMPVMNGWEFRAVQRDDPALSSIPVVVFSGQGRLDEAAAVIGAAANLRKPVHLQELLATVDRLCGAGP